MSDELEPRIQRLNKDIMDACLLSMASAQQSTTKPHPFIVDYGTPYNWYVTSHYEIGDYLDYRVRNADGENTAFDLRRMLDYVKYLYARVNELEDELKVQING